jgi:hypothetical protein
MSPPASVSAFFAFHHWRVGLCAQFAYHCCSNCCHVFLLYSVWDSVRGGAWGSLLVRGILFKKKGELLGYPFLKLKLPCGSQAIKPAR